MVYPKLEPEPTLGLCSGSLHYTVCMTSRLTVTLQIYVLAPKKSEEIIAAVFCIVNHHL